GIFKDGLVVGDVTEAEIVLHRRWIDRSIKSRMFLQRLEFRAKNNLTTSEYCIVERLDAEPVPRQEQRFGTTVPQRECEHSVETIEAALAPLLPGMHDYLGIASGAEYVTLSYEFLGKLPEIVDLTVVRYDDGFIFVIERLLAALEVDDRQAPVP